MKYFCSEAKILKFGAVQVHSSGFVLLLLTLKTKEEEESSKTIEAKLKLK